MKRKKVKISNGRKSLQYRGTQCLNCAHPLDKSDVYCPFCSQLNSDKQLSAKDFFWEFITSIVVFDSKLRLTLKHLLFKPGVITRNYTQGQRMKYANPFRFYLSVSIIYFLVNGLVNSLDTTVEGSDSTSSTPLFSNSVLLDSISNNVSQQTGGAISIADSIRKLRKPAELIYISEDALDSMSFGESYTKRIQLYNDFYELYKIKNAETALDSLNHKNTSFNRWVYSKNTTIEKIKEEPAAFLNFIIGKIPFFLFFFTPFFALFFWLIYSKSKYTYMEHMIFIFHIFSFIFLAMLLVIVPDLILKSKILLTILFVFIGPFYFYKALRNFYGQGRLVTLIKFVFLNAVFVIGLTFAALIFVAASAAIY